MKTHSPSSTPELSAKPAAEPIRLLGRTVLGLGLLVSGFLLVSAMLHGDALQAANCSVPGDLPTIQSAVDDTSCTRINLGNRVYRESVLISRSLKIVGPAAVADIAGLVEVSGSDTVAEFTNIKIENGCSPAAFVTTDGGQAEATSLEIVTMEGGPCPDNPNRSVFVDGFESGATAAWSATVE